MKITPTEKICSGKHGCGIMLDIFKFRKVKNRINQWDTTCRECSKKRLVKRDRINCEKTREQNILSKYGITSNEYDILLEEQNNKCAICGTDDPNNRWNRWHIDHCHKTNTVRGLLCTSCNIGLGNFYDNIDIMISAITYLQKRV